MASEGRYFGGLKVIYTAPRSLPPEDIQGSLDECLRFKQEWPQWIAGGSGPLWVEAAGNVEHGACLPGQSPQGKPCSTNGNANGSVSWNGLSANTRLSRNTAVLRRDGTAILAVSLISLASTEVFIGASHILLNGLYWGLGMIPHSYSWDLFFYGLTDVTPDDAASALKATRAADQREGHPSFKRTPWYAIRETGLTMWVERSGAAPSTEQWRKWLREADEAAKHNKRGWPAVQRKDDTLKEKLRDGHVLDRAAQHAPATEVRPPVDSGNNGWTKDGTF
ncbi:hypothetical protein EsDP_00000704 [Epichloe bromicola]|uniref:Uncharacterized protein n=1 Tax=Epichloe bromicola TaxID=79588 RepID=A0ABQ0CFP6_9HYPO